MTEEFVSSEFRQVVGACQEAVDNAQDFDEWKPPGSPAGLMYTCQFVDMKTGSSADKETGAKSVWVRLVLKILDGDYSGETFVKGFSTKWPNGIGPLFKFASMVDNDPVHRENRILEPAVEAIAKHVGKPILNVIVKTSKSKKTGDEYTTYTFDRIVDRIEEPVTA